MSTMCYVCGSEQTKVGSEYYCKICHRPFCQDCEKSEKSSVLDGEYLVWSCKSCSERYGKESLRPNGFSPYTTPLISPIPSMSSFGSSVSSCGDFPADMNSQNREAGDEALDTGQEHSNLEFKDHSEERGTESLLKNIDIECSNAITSSDRLGCPMSTEEICTSGSISVENHEDSNGEKVGFRRSTSQDVRSMRAADDSDGAENAIDSSGSSFLSKIETDPLLWMPPEPEDLEDVLDSVANNDDDDDYSDGTKWGQPSSLSSFDEETGSNYSYKEERQKAMVEAMNGQFKILVSRFLASEGIAFSAGEAGKSWLDIVASLSWEAALLVKPDANAGRAMDPGSYVKVKCIASGSRSQSQVIKGLVFKKNTAHKHMPIKWRNPRLLLLQGILGHSAVGLSSFDSMEQENYFLKSIIEMIETCHPNVVLVEKTVSRDVQESLLAKGITLVFDMKLPRLERISRCTGSQVISSADILMNPKLKQCDSFHIEKFVEEHNTSGEGGKRPTKTLMFLEGFPKPLGCTILLKGAHSDELKKVKRVVHYTIFAAYHLILETSFFADQRAIFSEMNTVRDENYSFTDKQVPSVGCGQAFNLNTPFLGGPGGASAHALDILISDRSLDKSAHGETCFNSDMDVEGSSTLPGFHPDLNGNNFVQRDLLNTEPNGSEVFQPDSSQDSSVPPLLPGQLLTSFSTLKKILGDSFPPLTSVSYGSFSSYFGFKEKELDGQSVDVFSASPSPRALNYEIGENGSISQEKPQDGICDGETAETERGFTESSEHCIADGSNEVQMQNKDDIESVLDPQSILVLLSSQCISKQCVCEQSHLSRIKYYGNFDVSLGRFLHDILLNQKHSCSECGEPPEGHVYCYTHQNGNLTVLVRRLPPESLLSGEAEGKIWMWTRCLKCERERGIPRSTRRVVMSTAARGLSFGKFLELSFSSHSAANRLSRCGHSLHRDCLRFFGLGSRVAMFRYSPVEIYAACKPPPVLEFYNPNGQEWFKREARDVLEKGNLLFSGVADLLQKLKPRISGSRKEFVIVEEMLMQEKAEFEASLLKAINQNGQLGQTAHEILGLKWLNQELLLELYVWDRRLHSLLLCTGGNGASLNAIHEEQFQREKDAISYNRISERDATEDVGKLLEVPIQTVIHEEKFPPEKDGMSCDRIVERNATENDDKILEDPMQITINIEESSSSDGSYHARNHSNLVSELKVDVADISGNASSRNHNSQDVGSLIEFNSSASEVHTISVLDKDPCSKPSDLSSTPLNKLGNQEDCMPISDHMQVNQDISNTTGIVWCAENITDSEQKTYETISGGEMSDKSIFKEQQSGIYVSQGSPNSELTDPEGWVWTPFSEMRMAYRNDFHGGYPQKFQFIYTYTLMYLSPLRQLITQEMDLLHFPVGTDGNVISVCEDEISGIIAAALALSQDQYSLQENIVERETGKDKGEASKAIDDMYSLASEDSVASSYWSSTGYVDPEGIRSAQTGTSLTSDLSTLSTEGLLFVDRLIASENLHPEIHVGVGKIAGKSKYSVVCIHAKQFYELRKSCCPSELAYISSLSRCKKWDAQGGKSKALFLKSMDDRFIIKQIKKTELDSFLKFAPDYFKHISHSVSSGSQTCLAKILGIYQVRQTRSGKEVKTDLMVMENLLFGRKMSRTYDLKGAVHSRYISESNDPGRVLLDQNFVEDMRVSPMYVGGRTKHLLQRAIWNDTSFLTSINVMDYSLLVGVDKERHELVFGIIDYLRQYTWDKQLETWVKASLVVPKNALPTVVSPKEYKKRFRKFMTKYFLTVPDTWSSSERCSGPCKFCSDGSNKCSKLQNARLPD